MTAFDRFDPFERRISEAIDEIAAARPPDYLTDVLRQTARASQRPRWSFPERWLRVDTVMAPAGLARRVPVRTLLILALVALLAAAALAVSIGSRNRVPLPFGPARNGALVYADKGDLYVRDVLTGDPRLLVGGDGDQNSPSYSPDGQFFSFVTSGNDGDHFSVANADGTSPRRLALIPPSGNAQAAWAPDSRRIALIYDVNSRPSLSIAPIDGSPAVILELGDLRPHDVSWDPRESDTLLVRVETPRGNSELYTVHADGSLRHSLGLEDVSAFGTEFTLSGSTWAPDGQTIAYNAIRTRPGAPFGGIFRVYLVNPDGTKARVAAAPPSEDIQEAWPQYSPDGAWILVHRWTWILDGDAGAGWLAVLPADGSAPGRDIGPRIAGGQDTGLSKGWSPDGTRVLMRSENTQQVFSIDPITGQYEELPWTNSLPEWQRRAQP
jgi:Tol biopolymer transport system component